MSTVSPARVPVIARLVGVVLVSFALVALAVLPQLTARLTGEEFQLRVAPLDPMEPFRGAYVELAYPDLQQVDEFGNITDAMDDGERGDVFITLVPEADVWVAGEYTRERPDQGPYLACTDQNFGLDCGVDSWFLPQNDARELEDAVRNGTAIATLRIDDRGNAALIAVNLPAQDS